MTLAVGGAPIYLREEGARPPVLFLHGNPDSADLWSGLLAPLREEFRCLAIDLPGFGRSGVPDDFDPSLAGMSRFVGALVSALGVAGPIGVVGHDFGAQFALAWAIEHPDRARRIVVANGNFFSDYRWHRVARLFRTPLVGELLMALTNERALARTLRADGPGLSDAHIRRTAALYGPSAKRMALRLYRAGDAARFRGWEGRLPDLAARVPVCVLWGDRDPYAPPTLAGRFGAREVHHFPDAGHWAVAEAATGSRRSCTPFSARGPTKRGAWGARDRRRRRGQPGDRRSIPGPRPAPPRARWAGRGMVREVPDDSGGTTGRRDAAGDRGRAPGDRGDEVPPHPGGDRASRGGKPPAGSCCAGPPSSRQGRSPAGRGGARGRAPPHSARAWWRSGWGA